jgi:hypothetical protein
MMGNKTVERLRGMNNSELNAVRRSLSEVVAELKLVEKNLRVLVNQNTLDLTPTLLSHQDTGKQERQHAAEQTYEGVLRVREQVKALLIDNPQQ